MLTKLIITSLLLFHIGQMHTGRSLLRPSDVTLPRMTVWWSDDQEKKYTLKDSHLEPYPIFKIFDKKHFFKHMLPSTPITYRYEPNKEIDPKILSQLIEQLMEEINQKKRTYTNFSILSAKNFNKKNCVGMLVLKFNDYPFILKLYIETPESFINPYNKGLDNIWFFPMGGGVNRHISGLTRIKNLETIKKKITQLPQWHSLFDAPRKWHWLPRKHRCKWLTIQGTNIGKTKHIKTKLPATYGIIADAIEGHNDLSLFNPKHTALIMQLSQDLDFWIDAHIDNFMIEDKTGKLVAMDTEHFLTIVGIKEKKQFANYIEWFTYLASKCAKDWFFRTKKERLLAQITPHNQALV